MKKYKKYMNNTKLYESSLSYSLKDAYNLIHTMEPAKFNESVDISIRLKLNSKTQPIRSDLVLPNGNGKKIRVLLLIENGDNNDELRAKYKIDKIGGSILIKDILDKKINLIYDYIITTPKMFPQLKPIAKILGPKKLMPTIKNGTVTENIEKTLNSIYKGRISIRSNKYGVINLSMGRFSFTYKQIYDNFTSLYNNIIKIKDSNQKSIQIKNISISTTMSPGIKISLNKF